MYEGNRPAGRPLAGALNLKPETLNLALAGLLLLAAFFLGGCGVEGEPLPPLLNVPLPAELNVTQRGDQLVLLWQFPALTTEGQALQPGKLGPVEVFRAVLPGLRREVTPGEFEAAARRVAEVRAVQPAGELQTRFAEPVQPAWHGQSVAYAVRLLNLRRDAAGFSNIGVVAVVPPPSAPPALEARGTESAIELVWPPVTAAGLYRVYRAESAPGGAVQAFVPVAEVPAPDSGARLVRYADANFRFGRAYTYFVRAVTVQGEFRAESTDSPSAGITAVDTFPPAVPAGLVAIGVPGAPGLPAAEAAQAEVHLSWETSTEADLAGYEIYRREAGGPFERLNSGLLQSPTFVDRTAKRGVEYVYRVTSKDKAGNESEPSEPVRVTAQE